MPEKRKPITWYCGGLHFECQQCGNCCSGPAEGYIWVTRPEMELIADFLKTTVKQLRHKYLKRSGLRATILEQKNSNDCVFLQKANQQRTCMIYPVRPNQCRTWPFWPENLTNPDGWNRAARRCGGISRGKCYGFEEIEKIRKQKKWWGQQGQQILLQKVAEIYNWIDLQTRQGEDLAGRCNVCGQCCDFAKFDHRLFVTPPEVMYLVSNLGAGGMKPMMDGRCPYNAGGRCTIYENRFAACRIFCCSADKDFQRGLAESALKKLKLICDDFQIEYRYADLAGVLNGFAGG